MEISGPEACGKVGAGLLRGAPRQQRLPTFGASFAGGRDGNVKDEVMVATMGNGMTIR